MNQRATHASGVSAVAERPATTPSPRRAWLAPPRDRLGYLGRLLLLAALYATVGGLSLELALPPGYASAIWPPSGLSLALLLLWGRGLWPGAWLGSLLLNAAVGASASGGLDVHGLTVAAAIATGSTLQALLGCTLVRRYVGFPTLLDSGVAVFRFFLLAGPVACLTAALVGTIALHLGGAIATKDLAYHAFTWWVGDTMGVFLVAPLVVVWALERRHAWRHRLPIVAGSVAFSLALGAIAVMQTNRVETRRTEAEFQAQVDVVQRRLGEALDAAARTVLSLGDFYGASSSVTESEFLRFAGGQAGRVNSLRALEWLPRVPAAAREAHEAAMRAAGHRTYRIFDSDDGSFRPATGRAVYYPVQFVAPPGRADSARGFDIASEPTRRAMLETAARSRRAAASAPVNILQDAQLGRAVLMAYPVFDGDQDALPRGYVLGLIAVDDLMAGVLGPLALEHLEVRLQDAQAPAASPPDYRHGALDSAVLRERREVSLADRSLRLEVLAGDGYLMAHRSIQAWVTQAGVFLFSGLLGAFLLVLTGRAARVEQLVDDRTEELARKNEELRGEIEERRHAESRLRLYGAVFEHIGEATMILDADDRIVSVNQAYTRITGLQEAEVVGREPEMFGDAQPGRRLLAEVRASLQTGKVWCGEVWGRHRDGRLYPAWLTMSRVCDDDGVFRHSVAVFSDITDRKAAEERMQVLARIDSLTALPNRLELGEALESTLVRSREGRRSFGLVFIDIDRFKNINDSLGHSVGDLLLREMAQRLREVFRPQDIVARQGGDEFVVVLPDISRPSLEVLAQAALDSLARPVMAGAHLLTTTASIGAAIYPDDGADAESLMCNADTAMYVAKNAGRGRCRFFTPDMNQRVRESMQLETELRVALAAGELRLHYQPQVDLRDGRVVGLEALLRWQHPRRGLLTAGEFIQVAEDSGLVEELGEWALNEACRQARCWQDEQLRPVPIAVNLSALQLRRGDTVTQVREALARSGLAPQWLELEVTESMLMQDVDKVVDLLRQLRDLGIQLSLDDFGTGYSSLAYLQRFPLGKLKVDRSFVRDISLDQNDAAICKAIVALAHTLGLQVVAEGVETAEQLAFLRLHRCDAVQGSVFSWALPPEEARAFLDGEPPQPRLRLVGGSRV